MRLKRVLFAALLVATHFTPFQVQNAYAAAPATGTAVSWTNDTYFDLYGSRSGVTTSDLADTSGLVWQVFYANAPLTIPADGVMRLGVNSSRNGNNTVTYRIAIGNTEDVLGNFGTDTSFSSVSFNSYTAGGFNEQTVSSAVTIPARRYFLIGIANGPYYRSIKTLGANRSAQIGGVTYVTAINTVYYMPHSPGTTSGIPTDLGGTTTGFTTYSGYTPVASIKFKATGAPPIPSLTTPDTPTVSSILDTSVSLSEASTVSNSQSYFASLYQSNGTTFIESRTITNAQVTSGFTWTGLTPNTSYKVGMTAVGDQTTYSNSVMSGLKSFTTTKTQTSLGLTFSGQTSTFNSAITITAAISGSSTGKITFYANGKRIPKCISKTVSSSTVTCAWNPVNRGVSYVTATFTPTSSSQLGSTTSASMIVLNRSNNR
jgi:hypothetical protein